MMKTKQNRVQTIGIIGGGQLGKMLAQAAKQRGHRVIILDPQANCPAAQVSDDQIVSAYDDAENLTHLNTRCDVITYEFENVDVATINSCIDPNKFPQGTRSLEQTQNRIIEKKMLTSLSLDCVDWASVSTKDDLINAISQIGYPAVLKTTRFGYDGKGQYVINDESDITDANELLQSGECILEAWLSFDYEASLIIGRNPSGEITLFPVSKNNHIHNILHTSTIDPVIIDKVIIEKIETASQTLANALELVGVMGVEFFIKNNDIYINEIAPRPHNSGHYSIEACSMSQFDIHIKALLNEALPQRVSLLKPAVMVNILGQHLTPAKTLLAQPAYADWSFHDYGKDLVKENRKMGHFTILCENTQEALNKITATHIW